VAFTVAAPFQTVWVAAAAATIGVISVSLVVYCFTKPKRTNQKIIKNNWSSRERNDSLFNTQNLKVS
jgi:hypothetical protein